ncbi:DUF3883 domain-containing protein [Polaribacter aquimarinus]|uniref:Protein NO VEIN C-terminal domain-containing protein n=1 Tax=Polaribacter aquimarinus TaxID=2100726 RepID=A0A2U2JD90_9FLAO|nr:DUF3883 domain-containing protein [Polaribacter aquimarinus]PWG06308.1 hypothetical protein DIS07_00310 [Polaribacter aquimarinus]
MIIDLDNTDNLLLKSNRVTLKKGLEYFSKIKSENTKNIFYNLTRTTSLKDLDIKFILTFLSKTRHIEYNNDKITKRIQFESNTIIDELIFFYYSILTNNRQLNNALFVNSKFTINEDEISIDIFSVQIKYRVFFTILQNLGLLIKTDNKGIVIIKNYALAKKFLGRPLKKISPEEFEKEQEQKRINGIEAEKFVLAFENKRLGEKQIDWVAQYIVNEGYDIASYNKIDDIEYNRFIEVKSYEGKIPYFYWSRNEVNVAKRKLEKYWIYLVNRSEMNNKDYEPIMKQNPIESVLNNENWDKQVENYKIKLISQP